MKYLIVISVSFQLHVFGVYSECCTKDIDRKSLNSLDDKAFCTFMASGRYNHYQKRICEDGTIRDGSYCGVGKCNIFGCNCDGGCRDHGFYSNMTECNELIKIRKNLTEILNNEWEKHLCDKYHDEVCIGKAYGYSCNPPSENCGKMSCEKAQKMYDDTVNLCAVLTPIHTAVAVATAGSSLPISGAIQALCAAGVVTGRLAKDHSCKT